MPFTHRTAEILEYNKMIDLLAELALTEGARRQALALQPSDNFDTVALRQKKTEDAKRLAFQKGYPSFSGVVDICEAVERAEKGSLLTMKELLSVAALFFATRGLKDYIEGNRLFDTVLDETFARLIPNRSLEDKIRKIIISEEMIADEASPLLSEIRRKMRAANNRVRETLQNFISGPRSKYLQENIVTVRDGRYVVPVKAEYRNEIKGLLHDTSSSGSTLFIEPLGVVEANNEIRELTAKEEQEIMRILADLSAECASYSGTILQNYRTVTDLAFVFSLALLAEKMRANAPILERKPVIILKNARHPLLKQDTVVPISLSLGVDFDTMVITGPNTGGKTVTLKTLGLFAMMVQAGMQIPADSDSHFGVFSHVLADIGDEQSIEQSLSTFSAHMTQIVEILHTADASSLVLFDELGSGTDPTEGAALATAVLEAIREKGALTAATTHYTELKTYALETEGVQNASCEFDVATLRPTYRLIVGAPGKSNAFAISERLGLDEAVVSRAKSLVSEDSQRFERVIAALEQDRILMERAKNEAEAQKRAYEQQCKEAEAELKKRTKEAEDEIKRSLEKARQLLDSARATSEFVMKQLEDVKKKQESRRFAAELSEARQSIRAQMRSSDEALAAFEYKDVSLEEDYVLPRPLEIGDLVYLVSFGQEGTVVTLPDAAGNLTVKAGILTAKTNLSNLRLLGKPKAEKKKQKAAMTGVKAQIAMQFKVELDVRGMTGDEGWFAVDKYLDDACLAGVQSVRIIHGKGTGALRAALHSRLRADKRVDSFRLGVYGEGDAGVTVVTLK
ncbi:MAG: endonuclease MutS2 [Clostridia bacterium]|nr:endonuclease MutS2 [Clostridia bacterium]